MKLPGNYAFRGGFSTDERKQIVLDLFASRETGFEHYYRSFRSNIGLTYKPTNWMALTINPGLSKSSNELQYVTGLNVDNEDKYIFATIDRKTFNASFRLNLNLSPNLTLQYWGQPFIATGTYYDHKMIVDPKAANYEDRFVTYAPEQISYDGDQYNIDENTDGTPDYSFDKSDFNVQEFLSNMVLRWEYSPGSSVYVVWSQTRSSSGTENPDLANDLGNLFSTSDNKPHNVFLIKFSYRFGLK
jgi:hypothetical protein